MKRNYYIILGLIIAVSFGILMIQADQRVAYKYLIFSSTNGCFSPSSAVKRK